MSNQNKPLSKEERQYKVVGQPVPSRLGLGNVTGGTVFFHDNVIPGKAYLKCARSPISHGNIISIDTSAAEKMPGVLAVLTHKDVPKNYYATLCLIGVEPDDEPVLADKKVLYEGEPIVAIIAETEMQAMAAAAKVKVELEELEPLLDVEEAMKPGAPIIKPWGTATNYFVYEGHHCRRVVHGDVDKALAEADYIVEGKYEMSPIEHAPSETTGCVAVPQPDGRITVYTNTQAIYFTLDNTALILQVPFNKLHFIGGTVGGGFGGKCDVIVEPLACLGAMRTGRPVEYKFSREEEMRVSNPRSAWRIYYKDGVMKDGRIVARKVTSYADSGAYVRHTTYAVTKQAASACGPYFVPNFRYEGHCVYTNHMPSSPFRGFGVTPVSYAIECQMDKIARTLGMDPWEIRFINAYHDGDEKPHKKKTEDAALIEVMQAAAKMTGHELPEKFKKMSSSAR